MYCVCLLISEDEKFSRGFSILLTFFKKIFIPLLWQPSVVLYICVSFSIFFYSFFFLASTYQWNHMILVKTFSCWLIHILWIFNLLSWPIFFCWCYVFLIDIFEPYVCGYVCVDIYTHMHTLRTLHNIVSVAKFFSYNLILSFKQFLCCQFIWSWWFLNFCI